MKEQNNQERSIRFITASYTDLFRIPNNGTILVTFPDRQFAQKCEYIDDYHTKIGKSIYHICEFAEILERNGGYCEPEPEMTLKQASWKLGQRGYLLLERTENGFRYEVFTPEYLSKTQGFLECPFWTMIHAREHILETVGLGQESRFAVPFEIVMERSREVLKASDVSMVEWKASKYYSGMRTAEHTLSCEIRGKQSQLIYEVSQHDDGEGFVIHSDGTDIWELMPEAELRKLEPILSRSVEYGHWKKEIDLADTVESVREVRYGLCETENTELTREQFRELHAALDEKEVSLAAARKTSGNTSAAKNIFPDERMDYPGSQRAKIR